jgi:hypothetical protein
MPPREKDDQKLVEAIHEEVAGNLEKAIELFEEAGYPSSAQALREELSKDESAGSDVVNNGTN